ncbi:uncharacterized protein LOC113233635 [Hyposmocoma kahamanoa]|uniref:uncharacterized protein LOC113233635 n=1 Tax=Hyposmocoma kahamanoa TaxID=1477025 RepID=UPI000E6D7E87|nr:uncharacterized protein LOC113233635 [Hyposmocoma kahamanoa]XP_026324582.1 uncharacterized protein LOC113233635 [Hyposmocoma kahamanoa]
MTRKLFFAVFPSLENYHSEANEVDESVYPWVGKVVHSPHHDYPVVCTASCIDNNIFITSARCLFSLRPLYTRVFYNGNSFSAKAFVTPSNVTRQSFDDIGFIIVLSNDSYTREWATIDIYNERRTDDTYYWFAEYLRIRGPGDHIAVGWTVHKTQHKIKKPRTQYKLTALEIVLGLDLCAEIFTVNFKIKGFYVPCYFGCDIKEFRANDTKCERAHGAEGGAIVNTKTNMLLGVATWGAYYQKRELPLGFSVANSDNFFKDKKCAINIRNDNERNPPSNYLQSLCPEEDGKR